ncbi:hypothetical protein TruAng_011647 [Truncatella angustata]|nr:hypothetical protein TruAng_011647 [Truncatella angustata]
MKRSREPEEEATAVESPAAYTDDTASTSSETAHIRVSKFAELDGSAIDDSHSSVAMRCSLPGHKEPLVFKSYIEYEAHYSKTHTNRCAECRKNFPSDRFLDLHIEECHDAFAAVLREKGEHTVSLVHLHHQCDYGFLTFSEYSCFVEGCDRKCGTPQKRRMHLIDKHMYPKNYFFAVTKEGIDGRDSLLLEGGHHRRRSSASQAGVQKTASRRQNLRQPEGTETVLEAEQSTSEKDSEATQVGTKVDGKDADTDMADLTSAMSTLQFVPTSVRFGRGKGRTGFSRR